MDYSPQRQETVTLLCGLRQWWVGYVFLHRVVDADTIEQYVLDIDVAQVGGEGVGKGINMAGLDQLC